MRGGLRAWATRRLGTGDLTALASVANGAKHVEAERTRRLANRGFITEMADGKVMVTVRGRLALLIKRIMLFH